MSLRVAGPLTTASPAFLAKVELDGEMVVIDGPAEKSAIELAIWMLERARDSCAAHVSVEVVVK